MIEENGVVISNHVVRGAYHELLLQQPAITSLAQPGQFVHVRVPGIETTRLRRPFSIAGADHNVLRILYKDVGDGSHALTLLKKGDTLNVLGPIGRGFPLDCDGVPLLVGGGYGVAPLGFLASRLPRKGVLFVGGRTKADILDLDRFQHLDWRIEVATEDGSMGTKGWVTLPLDAELTKTAGTLYACGPDGMLKAVGDRAIASGCKGWLSLDKHMVCGVGACLACVQKLRDNHGGEWLGRVCKDGPVFESRDIVW